MFTLIIPVLLWRSLTTHHHEEERVSADVGRALRLAASFVAVLAGRRRSLAPQFWVTLGNYIGLYSIVALGLVLLTGVAGQTSFGQAAFVGLGAYTTAYPDDAIRRVAVAHARRPDSRSRWSWRSRLGFITLRMQGHYLPLATIAWGISLFFLFGNLECLGGHTGMTGIPALNLFGHRAARTSGTSTS